jgi:FMN reductase
MTTLSQAIELVKEGRAIEVAPVVVAFGGTLRPGSSTEKALAIALEGAAAAGAETLLIAGPELEMAMYAPERPDRCDRSRSLVDALRRADGIIIGSPGYHGSISGLVKNALDYTEDMRADEWPYFHGRPVGSVATGAGWQGAVSTLNVLRGIVHALRGWNTPLGVAINTIEPIFGADGRCSDERIDAMLRDMGREVAQAAQVRALIQGGRAQAAG